MECVEKTGVEKALLEARATLHGIRPAEKVMGVKLGPCVTTELEFEGCKVEALLDTGSPVTIVSLEFLIEALWKQKTPNLSLEEWEEMVKGRIEPPVITLHSYGGGKLHTVGQLHARVSRGQFSCDVVVQA